ncbi:MAG TPA: hypothetical protein VGK30_03070 [Candidatus Binatia bacterium]|jgi:hypothetical protein
MVALSRVSEAYDLTFPVAPGKGNRIAMRDDGPSKRSATIKLDVSTVLSFFALVNPDPSSGTLRIFNGAGGSDCVAYSLPTTRWTGGAAGRPVKFRYSDRLASDTPVRSASVNGNRSAFKLKVAPTEPIDYSLDEPAQTSVVVTFTATFGKLCSASLDNACQSDADCGGAPGSCQPSTAETCATFVAPSKDVPGKFVSREVASGSSCPVPPAGCP